MCLEFVEYDDDRDDDIHLYTHDKTIIHIKAEQ